MTTMRNAFLTRNFYIPTDAVPETHPSGTNGAVCYRYEYDLRNGPRVYGVVAFQGRATKPVFKDAYWNEAARERRITEFWESVTARDAYKEEQKESRKKPHTLKVGDIVYHSWGWEQTNIEFYEVMAVTDHTVTLEEIGSKTVSSEGLSSMASYVVADASSRTGKITKHRVRGDNSIIMKHGWCGAWDGVKKYTSWYA